MLFCYSCLARLRPWVLINVVLFHFMTVAILISQINWGEIKRKVLARDREESRQGKWFPKQLKVSERRRMKGDMDIEGRKIEKGRINQKAASDHARGKLENSQVCTYICLFPA